MNEKELQIIMEESKKIKEYALSIKKNEKVVQLKEAITINKECEKLYVYAELVNRVNKMSENNELLNKIVKQLENKEAVLFTKMIKEIQTLFQDFTDYTKTIIGLKNYLTARVGKLSDDMEDEKLL